MAEMDLFCSTIVDNSKNVGLYAGSFTSWVDFPNNDFIFLFPLKGPTSQPNRFGNHNFIGPPKKALALFGNPTTFDFFEVFDLFF